jgi:hypothetical protein
VDRPDRTNEAGPKSDAQAKLAEYLQKEPLLVAGSSANNQRRRTQLAVGFSLVWLAWFGSRIATEDGYVPWALNTGRARLAELGILIVAGIIARRYVWRRTGIASFYGDRIVFVKDRRKDAPERAVVSYDELEGYRDDSAEMVQLIKKGERFPSPLLAIPTSTEAERVEVLALLDRKSIRRIGE